MARRFDPRFAFGFEGDILYELEHHANGSRAPERWTVRVKDEGAEAIPGAADGGGGEPALTLRLSIPDFARVVAEEVDPQELLFAGRFQIEGDLQVASRLSEMFGGDPRF